MKPFTLHVFSDGKRLLVVPHEFSTREIEALRDDLSSDAEMVLARGLDVVEHAYPLGSWQDVQVETQ